MTENREIIDRAFTRLMEEMGYELGRKAIKIMMQELGSLRITFPTIEEQYRKERDEKIYQAWTGHNHYELGQRWGISENQVRNIINKQAELERKKNHANPPGK